ncbi:hypothetical protein KJ688_03075 [bacterium]|nr:hypothetical protein [bacterium]
MKKYCLFIFVLIFLFNCELEEPIQEEPLIKIISPNNNSYVHEIVNIVAEAEDNKGIVYVEFYIDGETNSNMKDLLTPYSYDWNVINLPDSSVHTIYAKAVDTDDNTGSSKMVTVTVNNQLGVPESVQLEASISSIDSSVVLQWSLSTIEDFSYYSIYRDINSGVNINSDHLSTINEDTVTKYIDTNVLDNMTYYYAVYLVDQFGFKSKSNEVEISIPNKSPESVFLHNPTNVTDNTMLILWEKSQVHDFKKYSLFRSLSINPDQTSNLVFETTNINQNSYSDSELEKGVIYYYRLAVYDTGDLFSLSNVVFDTAETKVYPIPIDGLVAYYPFNGNANDESGNGNYGTNNGTTLIADRFGNENGAFEFDGIDDNISIPFENCFNSSSITVSAWVYLKDYPPVLHLFSIINNGTYLSGESWELLVRDGGNSRSDVMGSFGYKGNIECAVAGGLSNPSLSMNLNSWYHIVGLYDNDNNIISVYCNEDLIIEKNINAGYIQNNNNDVKIGSPYPGSASNRHPFNGIIDDLRIYNRVLNETEIQILYHENGW